MQEYAYIASKRIACFYSSKPEPHQFSILVRGIPVPPGCTCSEAVEQFFMEYHPSAYHSHSVVRRSSKLQILVVSVFLSDSIFSRDTCLMFHCLLLNLVPQILNHESEYLCEDLNVLEI